LNGFRKVLEKRIKGQEYSLPWPFFERSRADLLTIELVPFKRMVLESKGCNGSSRQWKQVKLARESYITIFQNEKLSWAIAVSSCIKAAVDLDSFIGRLGFHKERSF
jgi:hypothetical protein